MARFRLGSSLAAVVLAGACGCSLLVDASDLDAGCPAGQKLCGADGCVGSNDPAYGCRRDTCLPCELPNTISVCNDAECAPGACLSGYGCDDCHANLLVDELNCGACGVRCAQGEHCQNRTCVAE